MITQPEQHAFDEAVNKWITAARALAAADRLYAEAYGQALLIADGSNEAKRAAQAASSAAQPGESRDVARISEQAARWHVSFQLAAIGRRQPPV